MADRTAHSRRSVQKLWRIHLAMLIYRDRGVKVKIRINVPVRVNPVQITALYSHSSHKAKPNPNTKRNPNPINTRVPTQTVHVWLALYPGRRWNGALQIGRKRITSAPNIITLIPSSRKPRCINLTLTRHEQHAVARFTVLRLKYR